MGLGVLAYRPLARWTGISVYWEIGTGALGVVVFAIHLSTAYIQSAMLEEELAKQPCGAESPQGRCYSLLPSLCETAWRGAEESCKSETRSILKERPTALIGPIINRCRAKKMDRVLRYNRVNTDIAYCRAYFDFIDQR